MNEILNELQRCLKGVSQFYLTYDANYAHGGQSGWTFTYDGSVKIQFAETAEIALGRGLAAVLASFHDQLENE